MLIINQTPSIYQFRIDRSGSSYGMFITSTSSPNNTCPDDGSPDITQDASSTQIITDNNAYRFHGAFYSPSITKQVCKVGFKLKTSGGDVSGKTYTSYIYSLSGTSLDAVIATSDSVSGTSIPAVAATVIFAYSTNPTLTSGSQYAVVVSSGETDVTNYIIGYYGAGTIDNSSYGLWSNTLVNSYNPGGTSDCAFSLYWYD